jgi:hypothetical protein
VLWAWYTGASSTLQLVVFVLFWSTLGFTAASYLIAVGKMVVFILRCLCSLARQFYNLFEIVRGWCTGRSDKVTAYEHARAILNNSTAYEHARELITKGGSTEDAMAIIWMREPKDAAIHGEAIQKSFRDLRNAKRTIWSDGKEEKRRD